MQRHLTMNNRFFELAHEVSLGGCDHMNVCTDVFCHTVRKWAFVEILALYSMCTNVSLANYSRNWCPMIGVKDELNIVQLTWES